MMGENEEPHKDEQLKNDSDGIKIYKKRWYILFVFSLLAFTQGGYWNTWGPIAHSSEDAFSLTDGDIALFANWGPISYFISAVFMAWLVDNKGLRITCLLNCFLVFAGSAIRCITSDKDYIRWTINIGQMLNGLGGPIAMGGPPIVSATWFPLHERTTATSLGFCMNLVGIAVSFLIGPYIVSTTPFKGSGISNSSAVLNESLGELDNPSNNVNTTDDYKQLLLSTQQQERTEIMQLMYIECGFALFLLLLTAAYFPSKPDLPPSKTAGLQRTEFKKGFKAILRFRTFWLIALVYSISLGVFNVWQGVLDINLKPHDITQAQAGWLGFSSIIAGCVSSIVISRFADRFNKHLRVFLIFMYGGSLIAFTWFTLLINEVFPKSQVSLYIAIIVGTIFLQAASPLYFEMACEVCYPVSEGLTNVFLTTMCNVGSFIFLLLQMIPNIGTNWENWTLLGVICFCIPLMFAFKDSYNRSVLDEEDEKRQKEENHIIS